MVSEIFLTAVGGGLSGSVVTAIATLYTTNKRRKQEKIHSRAEFYKEKKVERVAALHRVLEKCTRDYLSLLEEVPTEEYGEGSEIKQAEKLLSEFEHTMDEASIYLSEEHFSEVSKMYEFLCRLQSSFVGWSFEPLEVRADNLLSERREELIENYEGVKEMLRTEVREPLKHFED